MHNLVKWTWYLSGLILVGIFLTDILLTSQNTLIQNGNWVASKRTLEMSVSGGDGFLLDRSVLSQDHLDLSKWYGHQEVITKRYFTPKEIDFSFKLPAESYLDFFIGEIDGRQLGIRFNSIPGQDSFIFIANNQGQFESKHRIDEIPIAKDWVHAKVIFSEADLNLQIKGATRRNIALTEPWSGPLGFRGGLKGAKIDNVFIEDYDGSTFNESFRWNDGWLNVWLIHLVAIFLSIELSILIISVLRRESHLLFSNLQIRNLLIYQLLVCLLIVSTFDKLIWSKNSFSTELHILFSNSKADVPFIENIRFSVLRKWAKLFNLNKEPWQQYEEAGYRQQRIWKGPVLCSPGQKCAVSSKENVMMEIKNYPECLRMIFLGSSQTIGAGATRIENTFFARAYSSLVSRKKINCLIAINLSTSGARLPGLLDEYKKDFSWFSPQLIVTNMGNNDSRKTLRRGLQHLASILKNSKTKGIFLMEANSNDNGSKIKRNIVKKKTMQHGIPLLDLNNRLQELQAEAPGVLWWDNVHLTNFGQKLTAEWLSPHLERHLLNIHK